MAIQQDSRRNMTFDLPFIDKKLLNVVGVGYGNVRGGILTLVMTFLLAICMMFVFAPFGTNITELLYMGIFSFFIMVFIGLYLFYPQKMEMNEKGMSYSIGLPFSRRKFIHIAWKDIVCTQVNIDTIYHRYYRTNTMNAATPYLSFQIKKGASERVKHRIPITYFAKFSNKDEFLKAFILGLMLNNPIVSLDAEIFYQLQLGEDLGLGKLTVPTFKKKGEGKVNTVEPQGPRPISTKEQKRRRRLKGIVSAASLFLFLTISFWGIVSVGITSPGIILFAGLSSFAVACITVMLFYYSLNRALKLDIAPHRVIYLHQNLTTEF